VPKGTRAAALADAQIKLQDGFLTNFGRPARESVCECERSNEVNLGPVMALMSGPTVGDAISDAGNALAKLTNEIKDDRQLVDAIFVRVLNRHATDKEISAALDSMQGLDAENKALAATHQAKEVEQKPIIEKAEQDRLAAIDTAKKALDAYKVKMAPEVARQEAARKAAIAKAEAAVKTVYETAPAQQPRWENYLDLTTEWHPLEVTVGRSAGVEKLEVLPDGSVFATALPEGRQTNGNYQLRGKTTLTNITAIKVEAIPDDRLPNNGPGLAPDGNFVLSEITVRTDPLNAKMAKRGGEEQTLKNPKADFEQKNFAVAEALKKGNRDKGWAVSPEGGFRHEATFEFAKPIAYEGGAQLAIQMSQPFQNGKYNLGRFRIWVTTSPVVRFGVPKAVAEAVRSMKRTPEQNAVLTQHFLNQFRDYQSQKKVLATAKKPLAVDPQLVALETKHADTQKPIQLDIKLIQLRRDSELSQKQLSNKRLTAAQDLAWALINSPAFLFNH
ncbi:MAG TPA: hypothetical protein VGE39_18615, partial [Prosthecobacter sp.]